MTSSNNNSKTSNSQTNLWESGVIESVLYLKLQEHIEAIRLHEASVLLAEADPKPRVETDSQGKPVLPTVDQFQSYFDQMTASHIKDQMDTVHSRWQKAAKDYEESKSAHAKAELSTIETERKVAATILLAKQRESEKKHSEHTKSQEKTHKAIHKIVKRFIKSPISRAIATQLTAHVMKKFTPQHED